MQTPPDSCVLIDGKWQSATSVTGHFNSFDPKTGCAHEAQFPVVDWDDLARMATAARCASRALEDVEPESIALFLERYAALIEENAEAICTAAQAETALGLSPRLRDIELPRTCDQLRQAAAALRVEGSSHWSMPQKDKATGIASRFESLGGAVLVIGPNNFPLAFNAISGGDFAAAIAAGNPVIAKGHPAHPHTTALLADCAQEALAASDLPPGTVQCFFDAPHDAIARLIAHPAIAAVSFTGSREAGLAIKNIADQSATLASLELSSLNPIVALPGALSDDLAGFATALAGSIQMGAGQFCTKPGLVFVVGEDIGEALGATMVSALESAGEGVLLSRGVLESLDSGVSQVEDAGAILLVGGMRSAEPGFRYPPTLLMTNAQSFLEMPESMQRELFGPAAIIVVCANDEELIAALHALEGQLTACLWMNDADVATALYTNARSVLRRQSGRLLENKMPTGVAVVPTMVHGGPFPATSHPGFSAVGLPGSIRRFAALRCYDNVANDRLPASLR